MSLFSTIQSSSNALKVNQLGLQIVGNNIANVNTPGYIRQELVQGTAPGYKYGNLILGSGVETISVEQRVDHYVLERMRTTQSQLSYYDALGSANADIESFMSELTSRDISSRMSELSAAFQDVANQPGNEQFRQILIERGAELAGQIQSTAKSVQDTALLANNSLKIGISNINHLTSSIAKLNQRIVELEAGSRSDAVGLRDERIKALDELSTYINITTQEQTNGSVTIMVSGELLVTDSISRQVKMVEGSTGHGIPNELRFVDTDSKLNLTGGTVRAYQEASNAEAESGFVGRLDQLARDIINTVNRVHSQGQGMDGFSELTGESVLAQTNVPLESALEHYSIDNGSFEFLITNARTQQTSTVVVPIKQLGNINDTTPDQLASFLSAIPGIEAVINSEGRFELRTTSSDITFSFANDTSGALAALGLNTFFTGDSAATMQLRSGLKENPRLLAASSNGVGNGANNAIHLAEVFTKPQSSLGGKSLNNIYDTFVTDTTTEVASQKGVTDGLRNFYQTLEAKHLSISGVNLDEEAVKMIIYQRAFQAQSRVISVASEMLDTLVNII